MEGLSADNLSSKNYYGIRGKNTVKTDESVVARSCQQAVLDARGIKDPGGMVGRRHQHRQQA